MRQKVIRSGPTSLAVIIPARFVHSLGVKAGDEVMVTANESRGLVNIKFTGMIQLHLPTSVKK